ncbi:MAG TPA: proline racemase family protein [Gaiellaceae bacterium]|nr:proline racemase family protein [Gaiellaceae bacterium]
MPQRDPRRGPALLLLHVRGGAGSLSAPLEVAAVDYHTAGEPFRIVTGGVPPPEGATVLERRRHAAEHLDHVRRLLVYEPRGHADMYGCFVTEPDDGGADLGVVFFHNEGYSTACGHGTIALVTWAVETGVVAAEEPETRVVVDVPSGRLETVARVEGGAVRAVRFRNVPAYVEAEGLLAEGLRADVAFGGAFYASVASPLPLRARNVPELVQLGRAVKAALHEQRSFVHPEEPELRDVYGVIFWERVDFGPPVRQRNLTVFADGEVDRSPCGSGTSARLALLERAGELPRGEELVHESVIGTEFRACVVADAEVGGRPAVVTEVEGSAWRTGVHTFVLDPRDPLGEGFLLR